MEVALDGELNNEQHAEDLVAGAVGRVGNLAGEDVAQGEEALSELVVGAAKVEEGEDDGVGGGARREGRKVPRDVVPELGLTAGRLASGLQSLQPRFEQPPQPRPQPRQDPPREVGQDDAAGDVGGAALDRREAAVAAVDLHEVAVLFAERAVSGQRRQRKVEQRGERAQLRAEGVGCARAAQAVVKVGEGLCETSGEVDVFLMRADNVGGGGEWKGHLVVDRL